MERMINLSTIGIGERNPNAFNDPERAYGWNDLLKILETAPTVDAVPVVRCGECEHAERYERTDGTAGYYCGHPQNTFVYGDRWDRVFKPVKKPDDFCSRGQRRGQSADVRNMEGENEHE